MKRTNLRDVPDDVYAALTEAAEAHRQSLAPLMERMWQLRAIGTPDDAAYVALAERLDARLVTSDSKLAAATGPRCDVELIA